MIALGWTDVAVLEGGVSGWPGERYSGVNVASKAFGEWIERIEHTPHLAAAELARRQAAGERLVVLDARPMREFGRMSIPGGVDCPGAELVYRVHDAAPDPDTTVVVNCAGRTGPSSVPSRCATRGCRTRCSPSNTARWGGSSPV